MEVHAHIFTGVLDQDSDDKAITNENYRDASDLLTGFGDVPGAAVAPLGNVAHVFALPAGTNSCIGAVEDKHTRSIIRFQHNSNNIHQILRFKDGDTSEIVRGSVLAFNTSRKITHAHVVDGRLLYWTDAKTLASPSDPPTPSSISGSPPRKINLDKGDISKSIFEYELYAGIPGEDQFENARTYTFRTTDAYGGDPQDENEYTADGAYLNDPAGGLAWLADLLEADYSEISYEDCGGCKIKISFQNNGDGRRLEMETSDGDVLLVGTNIYPVTLEEHHIDLLKEPAHCAPQAKYVYDSETSTNNVRRLCSQYRVRYIYDDYEQSAWGPVSNIALNTGVNGEVQEAYNAIKVDFTDSRLSDPSWLTMIRFVEVAFRDGNSNDWKKIERIPVCELGISSQFYIFRNDKTYDTIPSDELSTDVSLQVLKNFDWAPLRCGTLAISADSDGNTLLFPGAVLENYDNPDCVDMEVTAVEHEDDCLVDIIGTVDIVNDVNFAGDDPDFEYYPLGGIVVYLAGTSFFAISNNPADGSGDGSFRIKGVPNGKEYVLRAASFRCSFSNEQGPRLNLGNNLEWQKTSAPVIEMAGSLTAGPNQYERLIDLSAFVGTEFDLDTETGYGTVDIANQHYARRVTAAPPSANSINLYEYHVLDNDSLNADNDDRIAARGAERQKVLGNARTTGVGVDAELITDHNGYCFDRRYHASGTAIISGTIPVDENDYHPAFADRTMYNGGFKELYDDDLTVVANTNSTLQTQQYLIINEAEAFTALKKTLRTRAVIEDAATPLPSVLFVYQQNGRQQVTGLDGYVNIPYFIPYDIGPDRNDDSLIALFLADVCNEGNASPDIVLVEAEDPVDDPFVVSNFVFTLGDITYMPARYLKGGGEYDFGILYEDRGNRTPGAARAATLRIPVHPDGLTKWKMHWEISSLPPLWATHYRIVRMLNAVHLNYVQWVVRAAQYVRIPSSIEDPVDTTFAAGDATHILFGLYTPIDDSSTTDVTNFFESQDGQVGYVPQIGDRVRLILDDSGSPVNTTTSVLEAEIQGIYIDADGKTSAIVPNVFGSVEIKQGFLAEYLSPVSVDSGLYYEGGEDCYEIGNPGVKTRYHKGPEADQVFGTTPASGFYTGGDTYWRRQLFTDTGVYLTEHQTPSRLIATPCQDIGRVFAIGDNERQQFFYNRHRVSATFIPNSSINGLSAFSGLDFQDINRAFGIIKKTVFADNVLLAICQFKVQPIYINQQELLYLDNTTSLGRSERILNIAKDSVSDFGTNNPESVVSENGRVYFWDGYHGAVCRYAGNGVQDINNRNVRFFRALADERKYSDDPFVYGGYDRKRGLYHITFTSDGETSEVTMTFDESRSGWVAKRAFIPEMYVSRGQDLMTFNLGNMWVHDTNSNRANYYGVQYQPYVTIVVNTAPGSVKLFQFIKQYSNKLFECPTITIPANYDYESGMASKLLPTHFKSYEGIFHANFLRDMNDTDAKFSAITPTSLKQATAMLQGRRLRGETMDITLQAVDGSANILLTRVDVHFVRSEPQ